MNKKEIDEVFPDKIMQWYADKVNELTKHVAVDCGYLYCLAIGDSEKGGVKKTMISYDHLTKGDMINIMRRFIRDDQAKFTFIEKLQILFNIKL
jgi:hypothetical protein